MIPAIAPSAAYLAARLTLLALRASISKSVPLKSGRVMLAGAHDAIATDSAATQLAAMAKPLFCRASASQRTLVVDCGPLPNDERELFAVTRRDDEERGGFMGYLEESHGPGDHLVMAFGRDESLLLPESAADLWHREYDVRVGYAGDDIDNPYAVDDPQHIEARRQGAVGLLRFSSSEGETVSFSMIETPLAPNAPRAEIQKADEMFVQIARMERLFLLNVDNADVVPDSGPPKTKDRQWQERSVQKRREQAKGLSRMMEDFYRGRAMPSDVAVFIAECRMRCE